MPCGSGAKDPAGTSVVDCLTPLWLNFIRNMLLRLLDAVGKNSFACVIVPSTTPTTHTMPPPASVATP
jgi:hypothetical protein